MATASVVAERRPLSKDEHGAAGDMHPNDRVKRVQAKLQGLNMLETLLDDAMHRSDGNNAMPMVWAEVFFFISGIAADLNHEVAVLYDQMRAGEPK